MKVLLTSAYPPDRALKALRGTVALDRFGVHTLTEEARDADIILFVENAHYEKDPFYRTLRSHPLVRQYPEKTFMYDETDQAWCCLPGLYCSMPRRSFQPSRQRAFCYMHVVNQAVEEETLEPDLLFSFVGAITHPLRRQILQLQHPRAHVEDTTNFSIWYTTPEEQRPRLQHFARILARSHYVLCPRGAGTSSHRLFESMRAGRAPVIIADEWVAPEGPDWDSFSLRVSEADLRRIPEILLAREGEAKERGLRAREAWLEWFSPTVIFHRSVEACAAILASRRLPEELARRIPTLEYLRYRIEFPTRQTWRKWRGRLRQLVNRAGA
jgi:hypothetical protein